MNSIAPEVWVGLGSDSGYNEDSASQGVVCPFLPRWPPRWTGPDGARFFGSMAARPGGAKDQSLE